MGPEAIGGGGTGDENDRRQRQPHSQTRGGAMRGPR
jgi:hypothetical protein